MTVDELMAKLSFFEGEKEVEINDLEGVVRSVSINEIVEEGGVVILQ